MTEQRNETRWNKKLPRWVTVPLAVGLAVVALFFALAIDPNLMNRVGQNHVAKTKADLATLKSAVDQFRLDCGRYPSAREGFSALLKSPNGTKGWNGPYLPMPLSSDPWGNPYIYKSPGQTDKDGYLVESYGADGKPGGEGDDADIIDGSD